MDRFSRSRVDSKRRQSSPTVRMTKERGSFNMKNDQLNGLTKTVERFIGEMTTWQKMIDEDIKSLKLDLQESQEIKQNTSKSYLSMKKKKNAVKRNLE